MQTVPRRRLGFVIGFWSGSRRDGRTEGRTDGRAVSLNPLSFFCSKRTNARFSLCDLSVSRFTVRVANAFSVFASAKPQAVQTADGQREAEDGRWRTLDVGLWHCQPLTNTNFKWLTSHSRPPLLLPLSFALPFSPVRISAWVLQTFWLSKCQLI